MALKIPETDRIYNVSPLPEGFNPDDPTQVNADWIMNMLDKIVNGNYPTKSFHTYTTLANMLAETNPEKGQTGYVLETGYEGTFFIYNGTTWTEVSGGGSGGETTIYTITKTLSANTNSVNTEVNLTNKVILGIYVNGLYQLKTTDYELTTTSNQTTITFVVTYTKACVVTVIYADNVNAIPTGTTNYNELQNKPSINSVTLSGNKTTTDLGLDNYNNLNNKPQINNTTLTGNVTSTDLGIRNLPETITNSNASITLSIAANKDYQFTNNAITDITFSACETSNLETSIQFSTGSAAPTLTDNSGITWVDGSVPTLNASKSYLIVIYNKLGFIKEY